MKKVILAIQVTLDGFIEGLTGELDWAMKEDEETWKDVFELQRSADTLLLGRVMYPAFEKYWLARPRTRPALRMKLNMLALLIKCKRSFFQRPWKMSNG